MRTGFVLFSCLLHGAAVAAALGLGVHAGGRLRTPPPRVLVQTSVPSAPTVAAAPPEPTVVVEAVAEAPVVHEQVVDEPQRHGPAPVGELTPRSTPNPATLQRVRPAPSPPELPADPVAAPAVLAPAQPWVDAQRRADNEPPRYPEADRLAGREGTVVVTVTLDALGVVLDAALREPSPFPGLNREALRAVRAWRFEPARRDGVAVSTTTQVTVEFRLHDPGR